MAYKTLSTLYAVIKEAEFNKGGNFTDNDVVEVTSDSALKPEIDVIERKVVRNSYITAPALPGKEFGSGTLAFELIPLGNGSNDLAGNVVLEVALGIREEAGVGTGAVIRADSAPQVESTITADSGNTGDGNLTNFGYNEDTIVTETWTIECTNADTAGAEVWSVTGSVSGTKEDATTSTDYDNGIIKFKIESGTTDFAVGDKFTIDVVSHVAYKIYEVQDGEEGDAVLYKLAKPCGEEQSLAVKLMYGCDDTDSRSLTLKGAVPNSVKFSFPVADIATLSIDLGASSFETNENEPLLSNQYLTTIPYVGKNAILTVDNKTYEGKDVEITIENQVSDREAITSSGIMKKIITKKTIKGTMTVTFENWDELNKFKNNQTAEFFLEMRTETDDETQKHKFAIWLPYIKYTSVSVEDDDGVLANKLEFEAYEHPVLGEAFYLAHK